MKSARLSAGVPVCRKGSFLPPAFMRGVPEGRGESEYLQGKYSEIAHFPVKSGQTPSDPAAPGFARIHRATSPINGGGKGFSAV